MKPESQRKWQKLVETGIPLGVLLALGYGSWAFCYHVCWGEVRKHHSYAKAIGLIIAEVLIIAVIYIIWFQTLRFGPGRQPKLPLYRLRPNPDEKRDSHSSIDPPEVFSCDKQGFPLWCTECKSMKAQRTHHSSKLGYCVPRFDHYCTWIGSIIGKRNYRLFFQFCIWFWLLFTYVIVTTGVYTREMLKHTDTLNGNVIALYVVCGFWFIMLFAMSSQYLYYICLNRSAIDDIEQRSNRRSGTIVDKYHSVTHQGVRYILRMNSANESVYDKGIVSNWFEALGNNPLFWLIPWGSSVREPPYEPTGSNTYESILQDYTEIPSEKWLSNARERISTGDFVHKEPLPQRD